MFSNKTIFNRAIFFIVMVSASFLVAQTSLAQNAVVLAKLLPTEPVTPIVTPVAKGGTQSRSVYGLEYKTLFEKNSGVAPKQYEYLVRGRTHTFGLHDKGFRIAYQVQVADEIDKDDGGSLRINSLDISAITSSKPIFVTGKPTQTAYGEQIGNDEKQWKDGIITFDRLEYQELFEGIDMMLDGTNGAVGYTLNLNPTADIEALKFKVTGAKKISTNSSGQLVIELGQRNLLQSAPKFFEQTKEGKRTSLEGKFVVYDDSIFGFAIANKRIPNTQLVIDPRFAFDDGQVIGGSGDEVRERNLPDNREFIDLLGFESNRLTLTTTKVPGDYDTDLYGVIKTDFTTPPVGIGQQIVGNVDLLAGRCSYLPDIPLLNIGRIPDRTPVSQSRYVPTRLAEEGPNEMIILAGTTQSIDFPETVGREMRFGTGDIVVRAFTIELTENSNGSVIPIVQVDHKYTKYFGGQGFESVTASVGAVEGGVYLAGITTSRDFPYIDTGIVPPRPSPENLNTGFIAHISKDGFLTRSTLLDNDSLHQIAGVEYVPNHDSGGFLAVAGTTRNELTPSTTVGAFQKTLLDENSELIELKPFVATLDLGLCQILDYTFLGGDGIQRINDVVVETTLGEDSTTSHSISVVGHSSALDFPTTEGAAETSTRFNEDSACENPNPNIPTLCSQPFFTEFTESLDEITYSGFVIPPSGLASVATSVHRRPGHNILLGGIENIAISGDSEPVTNGFLTRLDRTTKSVLRSKSYNVGFQGALEHVLIDPLGNSVFAGVAYDGGNRTGANSRAFNANQFNIHPDLFYGSISSGSATLEADFFTYIGTTTPEFDSALTNYADICNIVAGITNVRSTFYNADLELDEHMGSDFLFNAICIDPEPNLRRVEINKEVASEQQVYESGEAITFSIRFTNPTDFAVQADVTDTMPLTLDVVRAEVIGGANCTLERPIICQGISIPGGDRTSIVELEAEVNCTGIFGRTQYRNNAEITLTLEDGSGVPLQMTRQSDVFSIDCGEAPSRCGDGEINAPEACDDGNSNSGDGCSRNCLFEEGEPGRYVGRLGAICTSSSQCELETSDLICGQFYTPGDPGVFTLPSCVLRSSGAEEVRP